MDGWAVAQVLKDDTALEDNKISNENFVVVMVTKVWHILCNPLLLALISRTSCFQPWREALVAQPYCCSYLAAQEGSS